MADVQVTCINKEPRENPHEGITNLGGPAGGGWHWTRKEVIASIDAHLNTFYTKVNGTRAEIGIVDGPNSRYLRTHADGKWNDNLLALPECR
jgi:Protein of unknown function (DUF3892)